MRALWRVDTECGIIGCVAAGKTLQKMRKSRLGWRIEELQMVAEATGVEWRGPAVAAVT